MHKMNGLPTRTRDHCAVLLRAKQSDFSAIATCLRANTPISNDYLACERVCEGTNAGTDLLLRRNHAAVVQEIDSYSLGKGARSRKATSRVANQSFVQSFDATLLWDGRSALPCESATSDPQKSREKSRWPRASNEAIEK